MIENWISVERAAARVDPAPTWRSNLARGLSEAAGVPLVGVFTCPPDELAEVQHAVYPEEKADFVRKASLQIVTHVLKTKRRRPTIAWREDAFLPLVEERRGKLRKALCEPMRSLGLGELAYASFLAEGRIVGGAAVWLPSGESACEILEPLTKVAKIAGETLEAAIALARGCSFQVEEPSLSLELLSRRELQVARLAAKGLTDVAIASRLGISEETVGAHLRRIFLKLEINSRLQLVRESRLQKPVSL